MMKRLSISLLILFALCVEATAAKPQKIFSLNLCTDQLLLLLAERENIAFRLEA